MYPTGSFPALSFGKALHEGLAVWNKNGGDSIGATQAAVLAWEREALAGEAGRDLQSLLVSLGTYFATYKPDGLPPDRIEVKFEVPMPDGATTLIGIIDRMAMEPQPTIIDTKTTKSSLTGDWFWSRYENSFALLAYLYAASSLTGVEHEAICLDAVRTPTKSEADLQRRTFLATERQRLEFLASYEECVEQILEATVPLFSSLPSSPLKPYSPPPGLHQSFFASSLLPEELELVKKAFACNHHSCSDYGGCPYLQVCKYGGNRAMMEDYKIKERNVEND